MIKTPDNQSRIRKNPQIIRRLTHFRANTNDYRYDSYMESQDLEKKPSMKSAEKKVLLDSKNRIKVLQELDKMREQQMEKGFEVLKLRRKQQDEETRKRICSKQARLTDTGALGVDSIDQFLKFRRENNFRRNLKGK